MFDDTIISEVWERASSVDSFDPSQFRKDACGAWIIRSHYGLTDSIYGWVIDHVYPQALGGDDQIDNLRAMQWENNRSKGDDYPSYKAVIQSKGNKNIRVDQQFTVNKERQVVLAQIYGI